MKNNNELIKVDSRNRFTIPKSIASNTNLSQIFKIYVKGDKIILEPIREIPERERWLFDPKNKHILDELNEALKQKADKKINLKELEKELDQ